MVDLHDPIAYYRNSPSRLPAVGYQLVEHIGRIGAHVAPRYACRWRPEVARRDAPAIAEDRQAAQRRNTILQGAGPRVAPSDAEGPIVCEHHLVEAWQVAGTVAAIVFGTIGATVAITKLIWDRRDRRTAEQRKAEEAELLRHERERLRREQAQWQAADQAQEEARRLRIYSESEAREFLSQPRATYPSAGNTPPQRMRTGTGLRVAVAVVLLVCVAAGLIWIILQ